MTTEPVAPVGDETEPCVGADSAGEQAEAAQVGPRYDQVPFDKPSSNCESEIEWQTKQRTFAGSGADKRVALSAAERDHVSIDAARRRHAAVRRRHQIVRTRRSYGKQLNECEKSNMGRNARVWHELPCQPWRHEHELGAMQLPPFAQAGAQIGTLHAAPCQPFEQAHFPLP